MKELVSNTNGKIGCDEVGRGPLAGPVVACAVLSLDVENHEKLIQELGVTDSKKLSDKKRQKILEELSITQITQGTVVKISENLYYFVQEISPKEIDSINILQASLKAMEICVNKLAEKFSKNNINALIDGNKLPKNLSVSAQYLIKGDLKDNIIGLASIIAKEYRDNLMKKIHEEYPQYDLGKNSGYPTKAHREALEKYGPTPHHRKTFKGVKEYL